MSSLASRAGILTTGRAESFSSQPDHHLKRTRYVHQVFLLALAILENEAFIFEGSGTMDSWENTMKMKSRMFAYWCMVMDIELLHYRFVRSLREGDFPLYVQVIDELCNYVFTWNQIHYSRWLPVHVKDMVELEWKHPDVHREFMKGNFVVQKNPKKFSLIAKDHSHEQTTKMMKGDRSVSNLYDSSNTLEEHILSLPEKLRVIAEFEDAVDINIDMPDIGHHEESRNLQHRFSKDVLSLLEVMKTQGNPFLDDNGPDLMTMDTREIMGADIADYFIHAVCKGEELHETYVHDRLVNGSVAITDTIKRNFVPTFVKRGEQKKKENKVSMIKRDASLVTQLFQQNLPDATAWGWVKDKIRNLLVPKWTLLSDASKACALLHHVHVVVLKLAEETASVQEQVCGVHYSANAKEVV